MAESELFYDSEEVILVMKAEYAEYLKSPHWRRFRREAEKHLEKRCPCGARKDLQLHHMTYERVGRERLEDVAWLCEDCHHDLHRRGDAYFDPNRALPQTPESIEVEAERVNRAKLLRAIEVERLKARKAGDLERKQEIEALSQRLGLRY